MEINTSTLRAINVGFSRIYQQGITRAQPQAMQLAMSVPSSHRENTYGWMKKLPRLREWIGDRLVHNLSAADYTIKNRSFELTVGVDRDDIEDDQLGIYNPMMEEMGYQAGMWPHDLIMEVINGGETLLCFDGQPFFDPDHPIELADGGTITQANLLTGLPLNAENYFEARARFRAFKGEDGRKFGVNPNLLVVPSALEQQGLEILQAERLANGGTNIARGTAELLILNELESDTDWFLADTRRPLKPLVFQQRKAPEFVSMDSPDDPNVFSRKEYQYGADSRGNAGYGLWFLMVKVKAA